MRRLSPKHDEIILALLGTRSTAAAAAKAGVSERNIYRLFKRKEFRQRFDLARQQLLSESLNQLARRQAGEQGRYLWTPA
jgi:AcrR family transcriptional regulator